MRISKPPKQAIERKQREEREKQELKQLKQRLKGKRLTQDDINELVLVMAKQQGFIEE